mgnify:FL=1
MQKGKTTRVFAILMAVLMLVTTFAFGSVDTYAAKKAKHTHSWKKCTASVIGYDDSKETIMYYKQCSTCGKLTSTPTRSTRGHSWRVKTKTIDCIDFKATDTVKTCRTCGYQSSTRTIDHFHKYTKRKQGGKCRVCGKYWSLAEY